MPRTDPLRPVPTPPRIELAGSGRSGTVTYVDGARRVTFWDEMASPPCPWIIGVPSPAAWVVSTGIPLAERDAVLRFVAERYALARGGSSWSWSIGENTIDFDAG